MVWFELCGICPLPHRLLKNKSVQPNTTLNSFPPSIKKNICLPDKSHKACAQKLSSVIKISSATNNPTLDGFVPAAKYLQDTNPQTLGGGGIPRHLFVYRIPSKPTHPILESLSSAQMTSHSMPSGISSRRKELIQVYMVKT